MLVDLLRSNAVTCLQQPLDVRVAPLEWGSIGPIRLEEPPPLMPPLNSPPPDDVTPHSESSLPEGWASGCDLAMGSDVVYEVDNVVPFAELVLSLRAAVTVVIGPVTRPSMSLLATELQKRLEHVHGAEMEEHRLSLLCNNGDEQPLGDARGRCDGSTDRHRRVRSGGVHRVLIVRQPRGAEVQPQG